MATQLSATIIEPNRSGRLSKLRRRLLHHAAELQGERQALRVMLPVDQSEVKDDQELCLDRFERGTVSALLEINARMTRDVNVAMDRVRDGGYGTCESCGEPISPARLRAVPFALRCLECQQDAEGIDASTPRLGPQRL
jgi:DnaK suppressor protein